MFLAASCTWNQRCWLSPLLGYGLHLGASGEEGKPWHNLICLSAKDCHRTLVIHLWAWHTTCFNQEMWRHQSSRDCTLQNCSEPLPLSPPNSALFSFLEWQTLRIEFYLLDWFTSVGLIPLFFSVLCSCLEWQSLQVVLIVFSLSEQAQSENVSLRPAIPHTLKDQLE